MKPARPPRWYFPPGVDLPQHVAAEPVRLRAVEERPVGGMPGGGLFVGGAPDDAEDFQRWVRHSRGYLYDLAQTDPLCLLRVDPPPVPLWATVSAPNGGRWRVPVLLQVIRDAAHRPVDVIPAVARIWRKESWELPPPTGELAEQLLRLALRVMDDPPPAVSDDDLATLALRILALGHSFDAEEVAGAGWLTDHTIAMVLIAACGESKTGDPVHAQPSKAVA